MEEYKKKICTKPIIPLLRVRINLVTLFLMEPFQSWFYICLESDDNMLSEQYERICENLR